MTLEQQIKQKKFKSELEKAMVNIAFTSSFLASGLNSLFKPYNISMQQFNVMRILKGQHPDPVSINDITDRMVDKMSNASRLVDKLKNKKLIERTPCKTDRRQVDVKLTTLGIELLDILNLKLKEYHMDFSKVTEEEYERLNYVLDKMRGE